MRLTRGNESKLNESKLSVASGTRDMGNVHVRLQRPKVAFKRNIPNTLQEEDAECVVAHCHLFVYIRAYVYLVFGQVLGGGAASRETAHIMYTH